MPAPPKGNKLLETTTSSVVGNINRTSNVAAHTPQNATKPTLPQPWYPQTGGRNFLQTLHYYTSQRPLELLGPGGYYPGAKVPFETPAPHEAGKFSFLPPRPDASNKPDLLINKDRTSGFIPYAKEYAKHDIQNIQQNLPYDINSRSRVVPSQYTSTFPYAHEDPFQQQADKQLVQRMFQHARKPLLFDPKDHGAQWSVTSGRAFSDDNIDTYIHELTHGLGASQGLSPKPPVPRADYKQVRRQDSGATAHTYSPLSELPAMLAGNITQLKANEMAANARQQTTLPMALMGSLGLPGNSIASTASTVGSLPGQAMLAQPNPALLHGDKMQRHGHHELHPLQIGAPDYQNYRYRYSEPMLDTSQYFPPEPFPVHKKHNNFPTLLNPEVAKDYAMHGIHRPHYVPSYAREDPDTVPPYIQALRHTYNQAHKTNYFTPRNYDDTLNIYPAMQGVLPIMAQSSTYTR